MPFGENLQTCGPSGQQVFLLTLISEVKNLLRCPKGINKKKSGEKSLLCGELATVFLKRHAWKVGKGRSQIDSF